MYKIAICDDEVIFTQSISHKVKSILDKLQIPFTLDIFSSCDALFYAISEKADAYQLMFLDILMDGMNGMELAQKARAQNNKATIVFITSTPDFSLLGYEVGAFRYLLKPVSEMELRKILEYDYLNCVCQKFLIIQENAGFKQFELSQISYLEIQGRKVAVKLSGEMVLVSAKLMDLEGQIPGNKFIRCHQSFIINIDHVLELMHREAIMADGKHIPISRAHLRNVQATFLSKLGRI